MPGWTFEDEMAEETDYSYYNSRPSEERAAAARYSNDRSHDRPPRVGGRSHHNRYEVSVDLHVPDEFGTQETSFTDSEYLISRNRNNAQPQIESNVPHSQLKYIHSHQNSAGGRSSMADSGYQDDDVNDIGGFHSNRSSNHSYSAKSHIVASKRDQLSDKFGLDNAAFNYDSDNGSEVELVPSRTNVEVHAARDQGYDGTPVEGYSYLASGADSSRDTDLPVSSMYFQTIDQMNAKSTGVRKPRGHVSESVLI